MNRLVCLDMAGTTVEDSGAVLAAFDAALSAAGLRIGTPPFTRARQYAIETMGQSKIEVFRAIVDGDETRAWTANRTFEAAYATAVRDHGTRPVAGAEETIDELRAAGHTVVLTTGFSPETRDQLIAALGWRDRVDLALSPADAGRGRPFPDMLLTALLRTGFDAVEQIVAVGDTTSDLLAGHRAGAGVVAGVRTGAHGDDEFATVPHTHVLDSVADLPRLLGTEAAPVMSGARS